MLTIGLSLGISLFLIAILFFIGSDITKRIDQIKQIRADLLFRQQLTESLALLHKDSQEAQNYSSELENILPTRDQLLNFPHDLSTIARQNKIELNSSLGQETSGAVEGLKKVGFTMATQGSFDNFINFLKSLETGRYFIDLGSIDFSRQNNNFKAFMNGGVFYF